VQDVDFELKNYRITHFSFIQSFYNYFGIIAGTNTGSIKVEQIGNDRGKGGDLSNN